MIVAFGQFLLKTSAPFPTLAPDEVSQVRSRVGRSPSPPPPSMAPRPHFISKARLRKRRAATNAAFRPHVSWEGNKKPRDAKRQPDSNSSRPSGSTFARGTMLNTINTRRCTAQRCHISREAKTKIFKRNVGIITSVTASFLRHLEGLACELDTRQHRVIFRRPR